MRFDEAGLSLRGRAPCQGCRYLAFGSCHSRLAKLRAPRPLRGRFPLNTQMLEVFKVGLPEGTVRGEGRGDYKIVLNKDAPPRLTLEGDLKGVALSIPPLGWSKPKDADGQITLTADLGAVPQIDQLALTTSGLSAAGRINLHPEGGLTRPSLTGSS